MRLMALLEMLCGVAVVAGRYLLSASPFCASAAVNLFPQCVRNGNFPLIWKFMDWRHLIYIGLL